MPRITPDAITLDSVPRRRTDLTGVELEGELVLYSPDGGVLHKLDPIATVLWHCLDGRVPLRDLVADVSEVFGLSLERATTDVVGYVRELGGLGLLDGVVPSAKEST